MFSSSSPLKFLTALFETGNATCMTLVLRDVTVSPMIVIGAHPILLVGTPFEVPPTSGETAEGASYPPTTGTPELLIWKG